MLGSKPKGLFFNLVGETALLARTTSLTPPFTVEELAEIPIANAADASAAIRAFAGVRGSGYVPACCAVYPPNRLVTRVSVDPRRVRDEGYLDSVVAEATKVDPTLYNFFSLSLADGVETSRLKNFPKDVLVCGAPAAQLAAAQERLLELGVFPERMEIGTVAALGGLQNHLRFTDAKGPALSLEVGDELTQLFVVNRDSIEVTRSIAFGVKSMIPMIQKELGLKDEASAQKLFFSDNFDFTDMGGLLAKRLVRELQASIGLYEVQTGLSIGQLNCTLLPAKVAWLQQLLADMLGMRVVSFDFPAWLKSMSVEVADTVILRNPSPAWSNLFCLMGGYKEAQHEAAA